MHAFAASFVVFFGLLTLLDGPARLVAGRFFFVYASVFNLLVVSVFWGFLADLFRSEQAKRLFGFIGLGGTVGGIAGGVLTVTLARRIGPVPLLLSSRPLSSRPASSACTGSPGSTAWMRAQPSGRPSTAMALRRARARSPA